jgi:hypothetical protein
MALGEELSKEEEVGYAFLCAGLVLFAGLMSGLTLGLLSLDEMDMEVRVWARACVRVRTCGHAR